MPVYQYTALSDRGSPEAGEKAASSERELRSELTGRGLFVQNVRRKRGRIGLRRQRIKPEDFLLFVQEFSALIRAGLTIPETLRLVADRPANPLLGRVVQRVLEDVQGGTALSDACGRHPEIFDPLFLAAIRTGEKSGALPSVMQKYQAYLRYRIELQRKVSHALAYPAFLLITLLVILAVLFAFVLPRFVTLYADFGAQLPFPTRVLIAFVDRLPYYMITFSVAGFIGWLAWRRWMVRDSARVWLDGAKERVPILGSVLRNSAISQFSRTLSTLLAGGTPLVEAMRITGQSLSNRARAKRLTEATGLVIEGKSLAQAMLTTTLMPATAIKMIEVGEATGALDTMLADVAEFFEESLNHTLTRMMSLIEPLLMLLMGVFVGGTIIVMYLPIFYIVDVIK
jgi:type IV pilus assembly protein PilC